MTPLGNIVRPGEYLLECEHASSAEAGESFAPSLQAALTAQATRSAAPSFEIPLRRKQSRETLATGLAVPRRPEAASRPVSTARVKLEGEARAVGLTPRAYLHLDVMSLVALRHNCDTLGLDDPGVRETRQRYQNRFGGGDSATPPNGPAPAATG